MSKEKIDDQSIKKLINERDANNPEEFIVIENKWIDSFYNVNCKNIVFKDCFFGPRNADKLFSNSYLENIVFDRCFWYDSEVKNVVFKNLTMRHSVIYNNVDLENCVFDSLNFVDCLMFFGDFVNCEIKNTDFRGQEYFFWQEISRQLLNDLFDSGKLIDVPTIVEQNPDKFVIAWYNTKYTNCIIGVDGINWLAHNCDKIDSNYSWFGAAVCRNGFINLENVDQATRCNLIAGTFLYDANQEYCYSGKFANDKIGEFFKTEGKHFPPTFLLNDKIDLSKYKKTLSTVPKESAMTILDYEGKEIDKSLISPLGSITFVNSFYKDSDFVESHFDAIELDDRFCEAKKVFVKK